MAESEPALPTPPEEDIPGAAEAHSINSGEQDEEGECSFCVFMKGGPCRDNFVDWQKCMEEAEKSKENFVEKCHGIAIVLKECMESNPNYYMPVLEAEETMTNENGESNADNEGDEAEIHISPEDVSTQVSTMSPNPALGKTGKDFGNGSGRSEASKGVEAGNTLQSSQRNTDGGLDTQITDGVGHSDVHAQESGLDPTNDEETEECGFCVFMKAGPCKDSFVNWEISVDSDEKDEEDVLQKAVSLKECMEANVHYYQPVLEISKEKSGDPSQKEEGPDLAAPEGANEDSLEAKSLKSYHQNTVSEDHALVLQQGMESLVINSSQQDQNLDSKSGLDQVGQEVVDSIEKDDGCGFSAFMKKGPCRDSFISWEECIDQAGDGDFKCHEATLRVKDCMESNPNYYEPVLSVEKSMLEAAAQETFDETVISSSHREAGSQEDGNEFGWFGPASYAAAVEASLMPF